MLDLGEAGSNVEPAPPEPAAVPTAPSPSSPVHLLPPPTAPSPAEAALQTAAGEMAGFALLAVTNAIAIAALLPPAPSAGLRALHHVFDAAETLGAGALAAAIVGLWRWKGPARLGVSLVAYTALATAVMHATLAHDLQRQALVALEGSYTAPLQALLTLLCGMAIPAAHLLGAWLSRYRRLRALPIAVALGGIVTNHLVVPDDYPPLHGAIAWTAATLAGAALAPTAGSLAARALGSARGRVALAALALAALLGIAVPPSNAVRLQLFREPGASAAWALSQTLWTAPAIDAPVPPSPWLDARATATAVPPTTPPLTTEAPVVVLITVDAVRAEAVLEPARASLFPTLARMQKAGATFTNATSSGSQTSVSLTSLFSSRTFSELYWSMHGKGSSRFEYAADDGAVRFPELLTQAGVDTATYCTINFLASDFGVTRGFAFERVVAKGRDHAPARLAIDPLLDRLYAAKDGPLFLYAHLTEPHAPYDRGAVKTGPDYDRYLSEIAVADTQIGRVERVLTQRFPRRGYLFVTSDHGEAFGEHETFFHTKTLYQELLHVPLVVRGPGVVHRRIDDRVGLVDLGPTILDLFGVPAPPSYVGQSLVPLLAGRKEALGRPLIAEGRLRKALFLGDLKVIDDDRRKVVEVFDLAADPDEKTNLFDTDRARVEPAVAALRAFFAARAYRAPGYSPPYKE